VEKYLRVKALPPKGIEHKRAHIVGRGLAGLAAAGRPARDVPEPLRAAGPLAAPTCELLPELGAKHTRGRLAMRVEGNYALLVGGGPARRGGRAVRHRRLRPPGHHPGGALVPVNLPICGA
jgi:hypothetical protein